MLWKSPAALCPILGNIGWDREIVVPMTVEYRNGVQSSTISYSNMVIPEGITNKGNGKRQSRRCTQTQTPQGLEIMSGNAGWMDVLFKDAQSQKGI